MPYAYNDMTWDILEKGGGEWERGQGRRKKGEGIGGDKHAENTWYTLKK